MVCSRSKVDGFMQKKFKTYNTYYTNMPLFNMRFYISASLTSKHLTIIIIRG